MLGALWPNVGDVESPTNRRIRLHGERSWGDFGDRSVGGGLYPPGSVCDVEGDLLACFEVVLDV